MKYIVLLMLACGGQPCAKSDGGSIVSIGVDDLGDIKLQCAHWTERYYYDGFTLKKFWWCDTWWEAK